MPLNIVRQDITEMHCDAIVNPTNRYLMPGGGIDTAVHEKAGKELDAVCETLPPLEVGQAVITPAFRLPCKQIIHTVGPIWDGGTHREEQLLISCYRESLRLARQNRCSTVAIPLISSGCYGYPKDQVMKVAVKAISEFLYACEEEMTVFLVVYDKTAYTISQSLFAGLQGYMEQVYREEPAPASEKAPREQFLFRRASNRESGKKQADSGSGSEEQPQKTFRSLADMLRQMDKSFAETVFSLIDQKGMTDVECYKKANVDKKTFSKMKCNPDYKPSKITAVSFAIALRLNIEETEHLLGTAGLALSNSNRFDVIIQYFILTGKYQNIFDVNEVLYQYDQPLLGV